MREPRLDERFLQPVLRHVANVGFFQATLYVVGKDWELLSISGFGKNWLRLKNKNGDLSPWAYWRFKPSGTAPDGSAGVTLNAAAQAIQTADDPTSFSQGVSEYIRNNEPFEAVDITPTDGGEFRLVPMGMRFRSGGTPTFPISELGTHDLQNIRSLWQGGGLLLTSRPYEMRRDIRAANVIFFGDYGQAGQGRWIVRPRGRITEMTLSISVDGRPDLTFDVDGLNPEITRQQINAALIAEYEAAGETWDSLPSVGLAMCGGPLPLCEMHIGNAQNMTVSATASGSAGAKIDVIQKVLGH